VSRAFIGYRFVRLAASCKKFCQREQISKRLSPSALCVLQSMTDMCLSPPPIRYAHAPELNEVLHLHCKGIAEVGAVHKLKIHKLNPVDP
jgi:hypothetical protein